MSRLKVTETFVSIQGEADAVGWPTLFVRLTGCPLRCVYCDTQYSFFGGEWQTVEQLLEIARGGGVVEGFRWVAIGGIPLAGAPVIVGHAAPFAGRALAQTLPQ